MGQGDGPYLLPTSLTVCLASFPDNGRNLKLRPVVWWAWAVVPWHSCPWAWAWASGFSLPTLPSSYRILWTHTQDLLPLSRSHCRCLEPQNPPPKWPKPELRTCMDLLGVPCVPSTLPRSKGVTSRDAYAGAGVHSRGQSRGGKKRGTGTGW